MPRLPDIESLGPRPTPQGGRPIASYEAGHAARALQGAASEIGEVVKKMELEDDNIAISAARRALNDWERAEVYDPEKGAASKSGRDAFGVGKSLQESFDKTAEQIAKGLRGPRQQQLFTEIANSRRAQVLEWADKHVLREREVFHLGEFKANTASSIERAALKAATAKSPEEMALAQGEIGLMQDSIRAFYRGKGRSVEEVDQAVAAATSDAHAGVLRTLLTAGRAQEADGYYKTHMKSIDEKDRAALATEINRRAVAVESENTAAEVWKSHTSGSLLDPIRMSDMSKAVDAKYGNDPDRRRATMSRLREMAQDHDYQQREAVAGFTNEVSDALRKGVPLSKVEQTPAWQSLPGTVRTQFMEREEAKREAAINKQERALDRQERKEARAERLMERKVRTAQNEAYFKYSQPDELQRLSPAEVQALEPALGYELTSRLIKKKEDISKAGGLAAANIDEDMFKTGAVKLAKIDAYSSTLTNAEKERLGLLKSAMEERIHLDQKRLGRPLERGEKQKILEEVFDDQILRDRWLRSPEKTFSAVADDDAFKAGYVTTAKGVRVNLGELTPEFKTAILAAHRTQGLPAPTAKQWADKWLTFKASQTR